MNWLTTRILSLLALPSHTSLSLSALSPLSLSLSSFSLLSDPHHPPLFLFPPFPSISIKREQHGRFYHGYHRDGWILRRICVALLFGKALPPSLFASNHERDVQVELVHRFERQNVAKRRLITLATPLMNSTRGLRSYD